MLLETQRLMLDAECFLRQLLEELCASENPKADGVLFTFFVLPTHQTGMYHEIPNIDHLFFFIFSTCF